MASSSRPLLQAGGLSGIAIGIGYIAVVALYVPMGASPAGAQAKLEYIAANTHSWWAILWLSVVTDLLFLPLAASLYTALEQYNKYAMLLAAACLTLFVVLDLALTWPNYAALITLSGAHAQAAESQKAALLAVADYPARIVESTLLFFYNSLIPSAGILAAGLVMRQGPFGKPTAYLGILTGILGIVSVLGPIFLSALSATIILTSVLTTVWVLMAGIRLLTLSRQL